MSHYKFHNQFCLPDKSSTLSCLKWKTAKKHNYLNIIVKNQDEKKSKTNVAFPHSTYNLI